MHHQMTQEQCGSQQQMQQPMMLCPVQYIYDNPTILPQPQEHQVQQNQILINVKNPPPWIQNRPQNQIVYVQQMPNNYQPYVHPQMIQNHMYHPQMSYQIQQMVPQDNRQYIQIPNLNQYSTVQNQTAQVSNEDTEKTQMPLLTQMLNQKVNANNSKAPNVNNVRQNVPSTLNMIRPIMQNQQVQTDNVSPNIKGRPRNIPPEIITINPIQQRQLINQKQEAVLNVRPNLSNDVPLHIKTKIPSSISVKTINRGILPRTLVRPFDVVTVPQNYYYNPIIVPAPNTVNKNTMINTESQYMKPNSFKDIHTRTTGPGQYQIPFLNVPPFMNNVTRAKKPGVDTHKETVNVNATVKPTVNEIQMRTENNIKKILETYASKTIETQTEEKFIRNTVYVQARGRVLNDKKVTRNESVKRTIDDRDKEERKPIQKTMNEIKNNEETIQISKKIKAEVTGNSSETNTISDNSLTANICMNIQTQQSRISNLQVTADNTQNTTLKKSENSKTSNNSLKENLLIPEEPKPARELNESEQNKSSKTSTEIEKENVEDKKASKEKSDKVNNNSILKEETSLEIAKKKESKITVLTHVLEGYIIQESNVAFPIQKPTMEKENKKAHDTPKTQNLNKLEKTTKKEDTKDETNENQGHFSWKYLNNSIESEKEMEFAVNNKDDPFANIKKSTVETWTADQLASHLEKYKWTETAAKLLDEEIDGESVLLVNQDQLVAIGVCEEHADVIVAFAAS